MSELPDGWAVARVGNIADYQRGVTYSKAMVADTATNGFSPVLRANNFNDTFDLSDLVYLPDDVISEAQRLKRGDILFAMSSGSMKHVGKSIRVTEDMNSGFGAFCGVLRPFDRDVSLWLDYQFSARGFRSYIEELAKGTNINNLKKDFLLNYEIPLPPLAEQRRIVEKIETLFAELDKGEESLEAAKARAGLYRQSLLKHAFEGHLTADWRAANPDKLEDPETLLTRIQNERDTRYKQALDDWQLELEKWRDEGEEGKKPAKPKRPKDLDSPKQDADLPLGWAKVPLGMVVDEPNYGTSKKCDYDAGPIGVLRIPNISKGKIDPTDLKSAEFTKVEIESYELESGDLLIIRSNGSVNLVGKGALVQEQHTDFLYAGYLIRLRANAVVALPRYVHLAMMGHAVRSQIESKAKSTSGVNNINSGELQSLVLSLCCTEEQLEVADRLDAKLSTLDAVEKQLNEQLFRLKALRQSILKRAFSGELVDQGPNDEPASVLLERIKAEKVEAEAAAKRDRKTKPVRKPKNRRPTMTDLIEVLKKEGDWVSASKAAQGLGIVDGTSSDDVEAFYRQLKERIEAKEIEVERRGDEDWLRLAKVEAT